MSIAESIVESIVSSIVEPITGGADGADGGGTNDAFQMTVRTTAPSETFTIPCQNVGTFNAEVDWGDGSPKSTITAYNDADLTHTYATAGDYQISITGDFTNIYFNNGGDKLKVISVDNLGSVGWTRFNNAFLGCANMTSFTAGNCGTSAVTNMTFMFSGCSNLTSLNVSNFNTAAVTNMGAMFYNCSSLTSLDLSSFNTSAVTNTSAMFQGCSSLTSLDVSGFVTSAVTSMANMFFNCSSLTDVRVDLFDITGLNSTGSLNNFMTGVTLTTARYDATLIAWNAQAVLSGLSPNFGGSKYTPGGEAKAARSNLLSSYGWTITDGGAA